MAIEQYDVSTDFTSLVANAPDLSELTREIDDSAITQALTSISNDSNADTVDFVFPSALSGGDKTILDGIVAAHTGEENPLYNGGEPVHAAASTSDPGATDDDTRGYYIGNIWVKEGTKDVFVCIDNTTGDAEWLGFTNNIYPVEGDGTNIYIYVRTTGSDTTGDGKTVGTAYRTIRRALEDVPLIIYGVRYVIDCTDLGQELNTDATLLSPMESPNSVYYDSSPSVPGFTNLAPLTIQATPTLIDTITAVQLTGQTSESTTNLKTLQTTKNYTLNQHRGKFIRDANNRIAPIASNTAGPNSDIEVCEQTTLVAPIEILEQSCEIRNSDSGGGNALHIGKQNCHVQFNGIKLTTANTSSFRYGVYIEDMQAKVNFTACYVDGFFCSIGAKQSYFSGSYITKRLGYSGVAFNLFSCFVHDATVALRNSGITTDVNFWFETIFDECSAIGGSTGIEDVNSVSISFDRVIIRNGIADGIFCPSGGHMKIQRVLLEDNTGDGVDVQGANRILLNICKGTGNGGVGLRLTDGAQAKRAGGTNVTGTGGDYKVGDNSVGTWSGFSTSEDDLAATNPHICRLFE